jgi:hypothetical protein
MSVTTDLRTSPPRRWAARIDGVIWLPRLIDKTRAFEGGTLGLYMFGQSPVDKELLKAAGIDYATLREIVCAAPDDAGVLAGIEARAPGATARMQTWSKHPSLLSKVVFTLVDADEGYARGPSRLLMLIPQGTYKLTTGILRKLLPLRR